MSVKPNTPADWITIKIQGRKCDIGPDATVEDVLEKVRYLINSKALRVPGGTAARHAYTAERHAVVRKSDVGTDEDGTWNPPESREDIVSYDLSAVEHGDELRVWRGEWLGEPVYEEVADDE